jgi:hypothetical protein
VRVCVCVVDISKHSVSKLFRQKTSIKWSPAHIQIHSRYLSSYWFNHRITIPAYAIEQQWWQSDVQKMKYHQWLIFKNDARSLAMLQEFVDIPVTATVVHLFFALTVSRWRFLFPTLCWWNNTKSMSLGETKRLMTGGIFIVCPHERPLGIIRHSWLTALVSVVDSVVECITVCS